MDKQGPVSLHLSSEFPENIMKLVRIYKIKMVYWDLGGTLVDLSPAIKERAVKKINTVYHCSISVEMFDQAIKVEWKRRENCNAIKEIKSVNDDRREKQYWIEFYMCVLKNLGIRVKDKDRHIVKWLATMQSNPQSFIELPFVRETIKNLREKNIPVGVISNAFPSARKILDKNGLIQEFNEQHVILSYEYNSVKPERTIYKKAIANAKVKPQEILFIDDRKSFVDGATASGMKAVIINDTKGEKFSGSGKSKVTKNEYSADPLLMANKSYWNPYFAELGVLLFQFVIGFLCNQNNQRAQYTRSLSLRRGM